MRDDLINNFCPEHNEQLIKFCVDCNLNTCFSCDEKHRKHKTINLVDLKPNMDEIKNKLLQLKKEIETFKSQIQIVMMKLNKMKEALDIFYEINNDILNKYEMKNRNYQILKNIKLIDNNEIFKRLKEINKVIDFKDKMFKDKICNIIHLYDEVINLTCESIVKVVLLGESKTGKTALIARYISDMYEDNIMSTTGESHAGKTEEFEEENQSIKFEIWDTPGQKKYRALTKIFYKDAQVVILLYDITNKVSFDEIRNYWVKQVKEFGRKDAIIFLVGNKSDEYKLKQVPEEEAKSFAKEINAIYHKVSVKDGTGINELFYYIGKKYLNPNWNKEDEKKENQIRGENNKNCILI